MDSLSQAALGAAVGQAVLGKKIGNKAAVLGAIGGTIPDLDMVLYPFFSDLQKVSIHRGYSHSILFAVLGGLLLAYILTRINWTKTISFTRLWVFSFLALFTHMLLDAFTSFGTQLFLPISDKRVSFDSISIVDPFYTVPLLIGLIVALAMKKDRPARPWWNYGALIISTGYLLFTLVNKNSVEKVFAQSMKKQNIEYQKMLTVPVSFGNALWYGLGKTEEGLYMGNYSVFDKNEKIEFEYFPTNDQLLEGLDSKLVDRMKWFAKDFYTVTEKDGKIRVYNMQCDMQGVQYGEYKAPTAFYFEIIPTGNSSYELNSGMHMSDKKKRSKLDRIFNGK